MHFFAFLFARRFESGIGWYRYIGGLMMGVEEEDGGDILVVVVAE